MAEKKKPMRRKKRKMNKAQRKIERVLKEYKEGELHSRSKKGPKVTSRKQAIAIALSEAGLSKKKKKSNGRKKRTSSKKRRSTRNSR